MRISRTAAGKKLHDMCLKGKAPSCWICNKALKHGDDFEIIGKRWMHRKCVQKECKNVSTV